MPCTISSGYTIGCLDGIGGIRAIYISAVDAVDMPANATFEVDSSSNLVDVVAAISVYKFELKRELSNMEVTTTRDGNSGTSFDEQSIQCVFLKPTITQYNTLVSLGQGRKNVFVEDNDGQVYLLGAAQGMDLTTGTYSTGTGYGDAKGFTLSMSAREVRTYWCAAVASITNVTISG